MLERIPPAKAQEAQEVAQLVQAYTDAGHQITQCAPGEETWKLYIAEGKTMHASGGLILKRAKTLPEWVKGRQRGTPAKLTVGAFDV